MSDDANKYMPPCVGQYERGDETCDGEPEHEDPDQSEPCLWRNHCAAFQIYLRESKKTTDDLVEIQLCEVDGVEDHYAIAKQDATEFMKELDKVIRRWGIRGGLSKRDPSKVTPRKHMIRSAKGRRKNKRLPRDCSQSAATEALVALSIRNRLDCYKIFEHFRAALLEQIPYKYPKGSQALLPGRLYTSDRRKKSKYMSIYVRTSSGRDQPLALVLFKPRTGLVDVLTPLRATEWKGVSQAELKQLHLAPHVDGFFTSRASDHDKDGARFVAQVYGRMIREGRLNWLPPPV